MRPPTGTQNPPSRTQLRWAIIRDQENTPNRLEVKWHRRPHRRAGEGRSTGTNTEATPPHTRFGGMGDASVTSAPTKRVPYPIATSRRSPAAASGHSGRSHPGRRSTRRGSTRPTLSPLRPCGVAAALARRQQRPDHRFDHRLQPRRADQSPSASPALGKIPGQDHGCRRRRRRAQLLKSLGRQLPGGSNPSPSAGQRPFLRPVTAPRPRRRP